MSNTVVVDDPALVVLPRPAITTPQRYFWFEEQGGGATYTVVALDREHAERILEESGSEFCDENGNSVRFSKANMDTGEYTAEVAARRNVYDDDRCGGPCPLNTYEPGVWFCSEY